MHFVEDPCLEPLEHMEVPCGEHHPPMRWTGRNECCTECKNYWQVHIRDSSMDAVPRPPCVSPDVPKPGLGGASQEALVHILAMVLPQSRAACRLGSLGCSIPGHRSVPHRLSPHFSRWTTCMGNHDVQCVSRTSFCGHDLTIHLREQCNLCTKSCQVVQFSLR